MKILEEDKDYFVVYVEYECGIDVRKVCWSSEQVKSYLKDRPGLKSMTHAEWKERFNEDPENYGI